MNYSNFIATLDIGTSKICLSLTTKTTSGDINVIDIESLPTTAVKYGQIINESAVAKMIQTLMLKVQQRQGAIIEQIFVSTSGTMLQCKHQSIEKELGDGSIVTEATLRSLNDACRSILSTENDEILSIEAVEYRLDGEKTDDINDVVGIGCSKIKAEFSVIKVKKSQLRKIRTTLEIAEVKIAEIYLAPNVIANASLTAQDKLHGAAAIEIGHSTTKLAIYLGSKLQYAATLPLGSQLITNDLCNCLDIDTEIAETLKKNKKFGAVCTSLVEDADILLKTKNGINKHFPSRVIVEIIEARLEEILLNVIYHIEKSGLTYQLTNGIVISGGIANMRNLCQFIKLKTNMNARIADIKFEYSDSKITSINTPENAETYGMHAISKTNCKKPEKKVEKIEKKEEPKPVEKPVETKKTEAINTTGKKKKGGIMKDVGSLFAKLFDENDENID